MPEIRLTEEQLERLETVSADVEAAYVGRYGRVTTTDAVDYLLDTYTPPSEREDGPATAEATTDTPETNGAARPSTNGDGTTANDGDADGGSEETESAKPGGGGSPLAAVAALLEDNDDVWRKSGGDAPYEVDLPDGSTEGVRTKDDVKRLLFKHYR